LSPAPLFDAVPGMSNPATFIRTEWPSTPRKWIVEKESVRLRETVWDCEECGVPPASPAVHVR